MKKLFRLLGSAGLAAGALHIFGGRHWLWAAFEVLAAGLLLHYAGYRRGQLGG